jgi:hypothetical protein
MIKDSFCKYVNVGHSQSCYTEQYKHRKNTNKQWRDGSCSPVRSSLHTLSKGIHSDIAPVTGLSVHLLQMRIEYVA